MSSTPTDSDSSTELADWEDLSPERQNLLKAAAHFNEGAGIERPDLRKTVKESSEVEDIVDSKDDLLATLNSTNLLNGLIQDGFLHKTKQGGKNPIVIDGEYDEERDTVEVAPFGVTSKLLTMAHQILNREGLGGHALDGIDENDFNAVMNAVNRAVGRQVMYINSDASVYRFTTAGLSKAKQKASKGTEE